MSMKKIEEVRNFGDVRHLILQTIMQIRDGDLGTTQGLAIAANMRELNSNIQCEINAGKLSLAAEKAGKNFGEVIHMGRRIIGQEVGLLEADE